MNNNNNLIIPYTVVAKSELCNVIVWHTKLSSQSSFEIMETNYAAYFTQETAMIFKTTQMALWTFIVTNYSMLPNKKSCSYYMVNSPP